MSDRADVDDRFFWNLAGEYIATGRAKEGELVRCLRVGGEFMAMAEYRTDDLVVKLSRGRVDTLIAEGLGFTFAPAKNMFREWVQVPGRWFVPTHPGAHEGSPAFVDFCANELERLAPCISGLLNTCAECRP